LGEEVIEIMIGLQKDAAAAAAIAAAGAAFGPKGLASKGHATFATMTRPSEHFDFVHEHCGESITILGKIEQVIYSEKEVPGGEKRIKDLAVTGVRAVA
jgi:hypothetical protein